MPSNNNETNPDTLSQPASSSYRQWLASERRTGRGPTVRVRQPSVADIANRDAERVMRDYLSRMLSGEDAAPRASRPKDRWVVAFDRNDTPTYREASYGAATQQEAIAECIKNHREEQTDTLASINRRMNELAATRKRLASLEQLAAS